MLKKYFRSQGLRNWIFFAAVIDQKGQKAFLDLFSAVRVPIRRHVKVKAEATPYDPQYTEYFLKRKGNKKKTLESDQKSSSSKFTNSKTPLDDRVA
jgi:RNA-directed DNA polymerase